MNISAENLEFPVLMVGSRFLSVCRQVEKVTHCSISAIKNKVYEKAIYVDSSGRKLKVRKVSLKGFAPPFWGFRLLKKREVIVSLEFEITGELSLPEVVDLVKSHLKSSGWSGEYGYFKEVADNSLSIKNFLEKFDT